jgi:hypothetical protein
MPLRRRLSTNVQAGGHHQNNYTSIWIMAKELLSMMFASIKMAYSSTSLGRNRDMRSQAMAAFNSSSLFVSLAQGANTSVCARSPVRSCGGETAETEPQRPVLPARENSTSFSARDNGRNINTLLANFSTGPDVNIAAATPQQRGVGGTGQPVDEGASVFAEGYGGGPDKPGQGSREMGKQLTRPNSANASRAVEGMWRSCAACFRGYGGARQLLQEPTPRTRTTASPPPSGKLCSYGDPWRKQGAGGCCEACQRANKAYTHWKDADLDPSTSRATIACFLDMRPCQDMCHRSCG